VKKQGARNRRRVRFVDYLFSKLSLEVLAEE
jgi:hypothetical protein